WRLEGDLSHLHLAPIHQRENVMSKKFLSRAALVLCAVTLASTAQAEVLHNKVVRDARGQVVHALKDGTCVRTDWVAGTDVCAPVVTVQKTTYVAPPAPPPPPP